ncbi:hypothetical protein ACVWZZ_008405 [Bradyrhizobium sp. LM6.10]
MIHKATQGRAYRDPDYATRRKAATNAGLLWGAYHFATGDAVELQIENFIKTAQPDERTLMVLDFEDNRPSNMSPQQAVEFLRQLEARLGRRGAIYSGNRLKESLAALGPQGPRLRDFAQALAVPVRPDPAAADGLRELVAVAVHGRRHRPLASQRSRHRRRQWRHRPQRLRRHGRRARRELGVSEVLFLPPNDALIASFCGMIYHPLALVKFDHFDAGEDDGVCWALKRLPGFDVVVLRGSVRRATTARSSCR